MIKNELKYLSIPLAFIVGGMLFFSCTNEIEEINSLADLAEQPLQTSFNATYDYTEDGQLKNRLIASRLDRYGGEDRRIVVSEGFQVFIYDSLGNFAAELTAVDGVFEPNKRMMVARNNVELINKDGDQLNTEVLTWDQDSAMIYTDQLVKITNEDGVIYGEDGLIADEKFENYELIGMSGDIYVDEESLEKDEKEKEDE
ncbi:LPS export ABC transporter periplasmic protein LptC [Halocola ammonii]